MYLKAFSAPVADAMACVKEMYQSYLVTRVLLAFVFAALAVSHASALVALGKSKWTVHYGQGGSMGKFEVQLTEKKYDLSKPSSLFGAVRANVLVEANSESVGAEEILIRYLDRVLRHQYAELPELFVPGTGRAAVVNTARSLREQIGDLAKVQILSEWFYDQAKFLTVRLTPATGAPRSMGFGFQNTAAGFLLSENWGDDGNAVLGLFHYLASDMEEEPSADRPRRFDYSLEIVPGVFGMTMNVDGQLYDSSSAWVSLERPTGGRGLLTYIERMMGRVQTSNDQGYLKLWCRNDRARLARTLKDAPSLFAQTRHAHRTSGSIKHIMTMEFANDFVHYYVDRRNPEALRPLFVGKDGGSFCVSDGPSEDHVRAFLSSAPVKAAVWNMWIKQS